MLTCRSSRSLTARQFEAPLLSSARSRLPWRKYRQMANEVRLGDARIARRTNANVSPRIRRKGPRFGREKAPLSIRPVPKRQMVFAVLSMFRISAVHHMEQETVASATSRRAGHARSDRSPQFQSAQVEQARHRPVVSFGIDRDSHAEVLFAGRRLGLPGHKPDRGERPGKQGSETCRGQCQQAPPIQAQHLVSRQCRRSQDQNQYIEQDAANGGFEHLKHIGKVQQRVRIGAATARIR
jgi:hypothetical protein